MKIPQLAAIGKRTLPTLLVTIADEHRRQAQAAWIKNALVWVQGATSEFLSV